MNQNTLYPIVEKYVEMGWSLIPIVPETKVPAYKWKRYQTERATIEDVKRWVDKGYYLAVVTGEISNIVVVDDDRIKHGLPEYGFQSSIISESKSGGKHYYFKYEGQTQSINHDLMVDIKGRGGYVLLPPFNNRKWIIEPTKERLEKLKGLSKQVEEEIRYRPTVVTSEMDLSEYLNVPDGSARKDHLHSLACRLFYKFDKQDAISLLLGVNSTYQPPLTQKEFEHNVETAYSFFLANPLSKETPVDLSTIKRKVVEERPAADPSTFEIESLEDLAKEILPAQKWYIEGLIPTEGVVLIDGAPATGKSFYSLTMAYAISSGSAWLAHFPVNQTTNVLFIDKENGRRRFQDRMRGLGISGENLFRIKQPERFDFTEKSRTKELTGFAKYTVEFVAHNNIGLIVIDSMVDLMDGDENSAGDTQVFFNNIRKLYPTQTVIVLHHEGKDTKNEKSKMDKGRGSSNIPGQADFIFRVERVKGHANEYKFEHAKSRDTIEMNPFTIKMVSAPDPANPKNTLVTQLAYGAEVLDGDPKKLGAMEIIKAMLPEKDGEILLMEDILAECEAEDISKETVKDAVFELKVRKFLSSEPVKMKGYGNKNKYYKTPVRVIPQHVTLTQYNDD